MTTAAPNPEMSLKSPAAAHAILVDDFAARYAERFGPFARVTPYDQANRACDYETSTWPAEPNRLSGPVGRLILGAACKLWTPNQMKQVVRPFAERADEIVGALREYPLVLINGHEPDLLAALTLFAAQKGIAQATAEGRNFWQKRKDYQQKREDMIRISHGIATRGMAPMDIGLPSLGISWPFLRVMTLDVQPHLSLPPNLNMLNSGITPKFRSGYNRLVRQQCIEAAQTPTGHPQGLRTLWSMSPSGTRDEQGTGEHEGLMIMPEVLSVTSTLIGPNKMGCGAVVVKFARGEGGPHVELGEIVPPNRVTEDTLHEMMIDQARHRRRWGETNVRYALELAA